MKHVLFLTHRIHDVLGFGGTKSGSGGGEVLDSSCICERAQPCGFSKCERALEPRRSHRQDLVSLTFGHRENEVGVRGQRCCHASGLKLRGVAAEPRENPRSSWLDRVSDHRPGSGTRGGESGDPGFGGISTCKAFARG